MFGKLTGKKNLTILVAITVVLALFATTAFAAEPDGVAKVTIEGGSCTGGDVTITDLPSATLTGNQVTTTQSWSIGNIIDATGSGNGWSLTLELTQFKEWSDDEPAGYVENGELLASGSVTVTTLPTVAEGNLTSSPATEIAVVAQDAALDVLNGQPLLTAAEGEGMGTYTIGALGVTMTLPANTYAGLYKSEATITLNYVP